MNLLIITQKVDKNDPILGFFHSWLIEFAKHFEKVTVICLEMGKYDLPENVEVLSLGKEKRTSKLTQIMRFYRYAWSLRHEYDRVFVHMNPEYVVLGGALWKLAGKKIVLWYTHRKNNIKLRLAEFLVDKIFTASKEGFNLPSKKVTITGHGIDIGMFKCDKYENQAGIIKLLQVGRITPIKRCGNAIGALSLLGDGYKLKFVGGPVTRSDEEYYERLKELVQDKGLSDRVEFAGSLPNSEIVSEYCACHATLNLAPTGGIDKVVLESIASGRPAFISNKAFEELYQDYWDMLSCVSADEKSLALKIGLFFELPLDVRSQAIATMRKRVGVRYELGDLISRIKDIMYSA